MSEEAIIVLSKKTKGYNMEHENIQIFVKLV